MMSVNFPETFHQLISTSNCSDGLVSTLNKSLQTNYSHNSFLPAQQQNYLSESADGYRHVCRVCGKNFRASSLLDIHMRVHVGAKPFVCPVCNHRATQKGNLKLHMKKHHGQDLPPDIDLVPDSGIWGNFDKKSVNQSVETKQAHSSLLDPEVVELIKKCQNNVGQSSMGRITESLNDFVEMAQNALPGKMAKGEFKTWKWDNVNQNNNGCNLAQSQKDDLHNAAISICQRFVRSDDHMSQPLPNASSERMKKSEAKMSRCKICGWETTSVGYLNVHMRKHKAESHICSICGRAFKETWYLKNHMRSHVNDHSPSYALHDNVAGQLKKLENGVTQQPCVYKNSNNVFVPKTEADMSFKLWPVKSEYSTVLQQDLGNKVTYFSGRENKPAVLVSRTHEQCKHCGQIYNNSVLGSHKLECGVVKAKQRVDFKDEKLAFMTSLNLVSGRKQSDVTAKSEKISGFNPLIACLTHGLKLHDVQQVSSKGFQDNPGQQQENLKSFAQQQQDPFLTPVNASTGSLVEKIKNESVNSMQHCAVGTPKSNSLPGFFNENCSKIETEGKMNKLLISQNQPYRNPAMLSLAEIGKTLTMQPLQSNQRTVPSALPNARQSLISHDHLAVQTNQGFQCRFCLKWFKYRSVLGIHMRSHTGERPYKCIYCSYAGTQHNCLKLHMQRHHPKEYVTTHNNLVIQSKMHMQTASKSNKNINNRNEDVLFEQAAKFSPARCPVCGRVSPSPGYLKIHMRSHKKTLDHICHICGRGFKEYWYLSTHLRTHAREADLSTNHLTQPSPQAGPSKQTEMYAPQASANKVLSKTISAPDMVTSEMSEVSASDHLSLTPALSWEPSSCSDDPLEERMHLVQTDNSHLATQAPVLLSHVSKRKAFLPSRHRSEPYPTCADVNNGDGNTPPIRSRKSKPRKITHSSYLSPVFRQLSPVKDEIAEDKKWVCVTRYNKK